MAVVTALALPTFMPILAQAKGPSKDVQQAQDYLRNLKTAKADFIQRNGQGGRLTGTFYLNRPGKLRFEYNEVKDFIVADGLFIYFFDSELNEQTNAPIGQTLADFLLRKDLSLDGDISVKDVGYSGKLKVYTLAQTDDMGAGTVKLFFTQNPFALKKWQIHDATGQTTEIELSNMETDVDLPNSLFGFIHPDKTSGKATFNE